jgi:hypothetical protein
MGDLTYIEAQKLERELRMEAGYVLDFSNRSFEVFFRKVVGIEIYDERYNRGSGSKANRLRAFFDLATRVQLRLFLKGILENWCLHSRTPITDSADSLIRAILERLGDTSVRRPVQAQRENSTSLHDGASKKLKSQLIEVSQMTPQARGYGLEKFLKDLFDAYDLSARASFRLVGEQIDGSFILHNETYLLEAKWQNAPTGVDDLHTFSGKIGQKATWSRGLFVSISGFTEEGLQALGRGKSFICMDGCDLYEVLDRKLSMIEVLAAKVRRAAESGSPFVRVRDLSL